jgi:hypothetical protein
MEEYKNSHSEMAEKSNTLTPVASSITAVWDLDGGGTFTFNSNGDVFGTLPGDSGSGYGSEGYFWIRWNNIHTTYYGFDLGGGRVATCWANSGGRHGDVFAKRTTPSVT